MSGRRRPRGDAGQASAEWLGMLTVVALVIAALSATGVGGTIAAGIEAAICRIAGGDCSTGAAAPQVPVTECETLSSARELKADVVVFSVDVGGTGKYTLSRTVDPDGREHWYVTVQGAARLGADVLFGGKANLGDLGEGVSAEVKAVVSGGGGAKYEFADEAAARDFVTDLQHEVVKRAVAGPDPLGIRGAILDRIDGRDYDPPPAKEYFFEGGEQLEGSIDAAAGVGGGGAKAGLGAVVGVKVTPKPDGDHRTVYLRLTQEAALKLGLFELVEGDAGYRNEVVLGLEYDGDGEAVVATLDAAGTLRAQFGGRVPLGEKRRLADIAGLSPSGTPRIGDSIGGGELAKAQVRIDLTQGDNRDVFADGLHSLGIPLLRGDGSEAAPNPYRGVRGIYDLIDDGAPGTQFTVTTYDQSESRDTAGVKGGDVLAFGVEGGLTFEDRTIDGAAYYSPGNGFVQWQACAG